METRHLLIGVLDQSDNLGIRLLETLDFDTSEIRQAAEHVHADEPAPAITSPTPAPADAHPAGAASSDEQAPPWTGLTLPARTAVAAALEASVDLGHNYLGCEHLLLGLLNDPDSAAGRLLRSLGVEAAGVRRALMAAAVGVDHARQTSTETQASKLDDITHRLDALERRLTAAGI